MARFVFPSTSHRKPLFWGACIGAFLCLQAPLALAQRGGARAGAGGHFGGVGRFAGGAPVTVPRTVVPRVSVPTPARAAVPPFRLSGDPRLGGLRTSGFRSRPIRPRPVLPIIPFPVFFGASFFGYWPGYRFNSLWWPTCTPLWGWGFGCNAAPDAPYYGYGF